MTSRPCGHPLHPYRYVVCTHCGTTTEREVSAERVAAVNDAPLGERHTCGGILAGATCYGGPVHELRVRL